MIAMCVTPLSRTKEDETPADLARKNGFYQCARRLGFDSFTSPSCDSRVRTCRPLLFTESYKPPFPFTRKEEWYHGTISRKETERRLREGSANYTEGTFFLVRRSSSKPGFYALSMLYSQRVFHFEICKRGQYYYIDYGPYLESLEHVVSHYMSHPDGLPAELQRPIRPPHPVVDDEVVLKVVNYVSEFVKRLLNANVLP